MQVTICYASWQLECCGEPFKVGDVVTWDCIPSKSDIVRCDYDYEAHAESECVITGEVAHIYHLSYHYENKDGVLYPVSYTKKEIENVIEHQISGEYLVILTHASIQ